MLPEQKTLRGRKLVWRHAPLVSDDPLLAWQGLLSARNLTESDSFFTPRLSDLPDPFAMQDMDKAATRLCAAILETEPIHVFGDFDADGVNGTAILVEALRATGAAVSFSIPHRSADGHGIGVGPVLEAVKRGIRVGISVDTGTTCTDACVAARDAGMDLMVTDHHLPEEVLPPAFALLNPARADCGFADRRLCGTGVAFFLLMAVWKLLREANHAPAFDLRCLLDRVAVATVADVMDLVGVNRVLVYHGLQKLNNEPSVGMAALMHVARVKKAVSAETIGFYLAPRINAAGRMQHGEAAMRMLSTQDSDEAASLAVELDEANKHRRLVEAEVFKQAEAELAGSDILATYDKAWHAGVVGLAAGRLARKHGRPAAVGFITPEGGVRVSLRGTPGFHIGELLSSCGDYLDGFGGHAGAGGGSIKEGSWDDFVSAFGKAVEGQAGEAADHLELMVDGVLGLRSMHAGLAERLARFEPLGRGNPACSWVLKDVHIADRRDMKGGVSRLKVGDGTAWLDCIIFGANGFSQPLQPGCVVSLVGQLQIDDYRGGGAVQFVVEDALIDV